MCSSLLFAIIIFAFAHANPHVHSHPKYLVTHRGKIIDTNRSQTTGHDMLLSLGEHNRMIATPSTVVNDGDTVTVSWANVSYGKDSDWIGMFRLTDDIASLDVAPIKFEYACAYKHVCPSGTVTFKILNRRTPYVFAYVSGDSQWREFKGVSNIVQFKDENKPMRAHLAVGKVIGSMQVIWQQKSVDRPRIRWGTSASALTDSTTRITKTTFKPSDMCDQDIGAAAGLGGYFDPGFILYGFMTGLKPATTYYYSVGDDTYGWTSVKSFTSPPKLGSSIDPSKGTRMLAFGDMGQVPIDFTYHHSWDWYNRGELYSINTTHQMAKVADRYDFVLHIGDISYAVGFLSEWDTFFYQIEPVATIKPYMTGIGNHEFAWSKEWTPASASFAYGLDDSNGECGVPYNAFFPFASLNPNVSYADRKPWYFFDYGTVRTIVMSTEHDFSRGSMQWEYISAILTETDRSVTPWIVFAGHRPMYCSSTWSGDVDTGLALQDSLEGLLQTHKVALGLWGHQHSYSRTCPVYNGTCQTDGSGTVHLVIGMAGYELTKSIPSNPAPIFKYTSNQEYGFVIFNFQSATTLTGEYVNAETGENVETFTVTNPYK